MTRSVITLRDKNLIIHTTLQRFVEWNSRAEEFFFDLAETVQARLELEVMITGAFGDGGDDGDVEALGADVVGGGDDGDVDV